MERRMYKTKNLIFTFFLMIFSVSLAIANTEEKKQKIKMVLCRWTNYAPLQRFLQKLKAITLNQLMIGNYLKMR